MPIHCWVYRRKRNLSSDLIPFIHLQLLDNAPSIAREVVEEEVVEEHEEEEDKEDFIKVVDMDLIESWSRDGLSNLESTSV